jgi:predicted phosphoribosyltransferase
MRGKIFTDRRQAGKLLAQEVARRGYADPVVLGLPRGGVPVAAEVAAVLKAPLDVVLVRKIGAPFQGELAMGAVVDGDAPEIVRNEDVVREFGVTDVEFQKAAEEQLKIIEARRALWVAGRTRAPIKDRTVIIVDDGIATGATIRASLHALKRRGAKRTVVATPVAPPSTVESLLQEADDVICLETPEYFGAIGFYYLDFSQVSDAQVTNILESMSREAVSEQRAN